jgi:hypothetical protein
MYFYNNFMKLKKINFKKVQKGAARSSVSKPVFCARGPLLQV